MLNFIKKHLSITRKEEVYTTQPYNFIKDQSIEKELLSQGYCIVDFVDQNQINLLKELYETEHNIPQGEGGMFLSTFSKDITYRKKIHFTARKILHQSFEKWFADYEDNINSFAIKMPGKESHFIVHQDVAAIDETKYSLLNIWTPLQDVDSANGALFVVPQSHSVFSPFRCPTVPPILNNVQVNFYDYAIPVYLKAGQAIFFDPRIFHYSALNLSETPRVVIQSRIYPKKADVIVYYNGNPNNKTIVEKWKCPKDYFIYGNVYSDDVRPEGCDFLGNETYSTPAVGELASVLKNKIGKKKEDQVSDTFHYQPDFIREPQSHEKGS